MQEDKYIVFKLKVSLKVQENLKNKSGDRNLRTKIYIMRKIFKTTD